MLTRCPGCQTVFRLTSDQLLARQGRVRCGSCLHPFNALDHLAESDPKAGQQPSPPPQRQPAKAPAAPSTAQKPAATPKPAAAPKPAVTAKPAVTPASSAATVVPGTKPGTLPVQPTPAPKASPKVKQVLAPVIRKTSQRSLSELDFSSSIDTQSRIPKSGMQWTASQEFPPPGQSFTDTVVPLEPVQAPVAPKARTALPAQAAPPPSPPPETPPPAPVALPAISPKPPPRTKVVEAARPETPPAVPSDRPPVSVPPPAPSPKAPPLAPPESPPPPSKASSLVEESLASFSRMPPFTSADLPPPEGALPQVTRGRKNQERQQERPQKKRQSKPQKRVAPTKPSRWMSTLAGIGKVLEEQRTKWGKRRERVTQEANEAIDNEVLSEVFSKLGIESKIDKIEAEFNAEAKAARAAARDKSKPTDAASSTKSNTPKPPPSSHFDVYSRSGVHVQHHRFWTISVVVLGVMLVIQSVFLFRNGIARTFPGTRPALVSLCEAFGCAMPLPRDASKIEIVDYGFTRRNDRPDLYVFYAKVKNNADFVQDWPNLELILKNSILQPLSRRILVPAEWASPEKLSTNASMAPRSSVDVNLEMEITEIVPSNFEVGHFYP